MWKSAVVSVALLLMAGAASAQTIGPSTGSEPYLLPNPTLPAGTISTTSVLTVGDHVGSYRMVGIPDGLGAYKGDGGTLELMMNHELGSAAGAVRSHGATGAFVSRWTIDRKTLAVSAGRDNATSPATVHAYDRAGARYVTGPVAWQRFCSGDLATPGAFFHAGYGTHDRIFLNGEENGAGRAWAHVVSGASDGQVWELPRLGRYAFENVVASPHPQRKTIVMGLDDSSASTSPTPPNVPSELYVYIGTKTKQGNPVERAGLTNGSLFGVQVVVNGAAVGGESNANGLGTTTYVGGGRFRLVELGDVSGLSDSQLQQKSIEQSVTRFQRVEDGSWDPRKHHARDFYFVTTASFTTNSRLWRLRFDDIEHPEAGGTIEVLLKGDEGHRMLDNITVDHLGRILLQEDIGGQDQLGRVWLYSIATGDLVPIATHNPALFAPGAARFLTRDEESSGIIDAGKLLGKGWFLLDVQAHYNIGDPELVEDGQLLAMYVDPALGAAPEEDDDEGDD